MLRHYRWPSIKSALKHDCRRIEVTPGSMLRPKDLSSRTDLKLVVPQRRSSASVCRKAPSNLAPGVAVCILTCGSSDCFWKDEWMTAIPENPSDAWCKEIEKVTRWPFQYYWLGIDDLKGVNISIKWPQWTLVWHFQVFKASKQTSTCRYGRYAEYNDSSDDEDLLCTHWRRKVLSRTLGHPIKKIRPDNA